MSNDLVPQAGRDVLRTLLRHYGSPEEANRAISEAAEDVESIESWATLMNVQSERRRVAAGEVPIPVTEKYGIEWKLEQIPAHMQPWALETMAAAYLAWQIGER